MISGNNGNRVREAPVSRGRIYAYVMPSSGRIVASLSRSCGEGALRRRGVSAQEGVWHGFQCDCLPHLQGVPEPRLRRSREDASWGARDVTVGRRDEVVFPVRRRRPETNRWFNRLTANVRRSIRYPGDLPDSAQQVSSCAKILLFQFPCGYRAGFDCCLCRLVSHWESEDLRSREWFDPRCHVGRA